MVVKRGLVVPCALLAVLFLGGAAPRMMRGGAGPGVMLDAVEGCARDASYEVQRMGQILRVVTPDAVVGFSSAAADGLALMVTARGGTPKDERPAKVAVGQEQGDTLWACALAATESKAAEAKDTPNLIERVVDSLGTSPVEPAAPSTDATPASAPPTPDSSRAVDGSCCVNGAFFECPTIDAVNTCTGNFMTCQSGCGMDFSCIENCTQTHPIDPSGCSRAPARDGEC